MVRLVCPRLLRLAQEAAERRQQQQQQQQLGALPGSTASDGMALGGQQMTVAGAEQLLLPQQQQSQTFMLSTPSVSEEGADRWQRQQQQQQQQLRFLRESQPFQQLQSQQEYLAMPSRQLQQPQQARIQQQQPYAQAGAGELAGFGLVGTSIQQQTQLQQQQQQLDEVQLQLSALGVSVPGVLPGQQGQQQRRQQQVQVLGSLGLVGGTQQHLTAAPVRIGAAAGADGGALGLVGGEAAYVFGSGGPGGGVSAFLSEDLDRAAISAAGGGGGSLSASAWAQRLQQQQQQQGASGLFTALPPRFPPRALRIQTQRQPSPMGAAASFAPSASAPASLPSPSVLYIADPYSPSFLSLLQHAFACPHIGLSVMSGSGQASLVALYCPASVANPPDADGGALGSSTTNSGTGATVWGATVYLVDVIHGAVAAAAGLGGGGRAGAAAASQVEGALAALSQALCGLLEDPGVAKVVHGCAQVRSLELLLGCNVAPLLDTRVLLDAVTAMLPPLPPPLPPAAALAAAAAAAAAGGPLSAAEAGAMRQVQQHVLALRTALQGVELWADAPELMAALAERHAACLRAELWAATGRDRWGRGSGRAMGTGAKKESRARIRDGQLADDGPARKAATVADPSGVLPKSWGAITANNASYAWAVDGPAPLPP